MVLATALNPLPLALVADGDSDSRSMYAESLKLSRWVVDEAADGRDALAMALSRRPDLIITDTHLPGISGLDLCSILRRDVATRSTPIVLVTSAGHAPDLERARVAGATTVLVKPCLPDALLAAADALIEQSRLLRARSAEACRKIPRQLADSARLLEQSQAAARRIMSRTHQRGETDVPPAAPPPLICPSCDRALDYKSSQLGGVSARNAEQWDYFVCSTGCGTFQYRQRTRKLRRV
jgi:CheY-like chemotaxis protein